MECFFLALNVLHNNRCDLVFTCLTKLTYLTRSRHAICCMMYCVSSAKSRPLSIFPNLDICHD